MSVIVDFHMSCLHYLSAHSDVEQYAKYEEQSRQLGGRYSWASIHREKHRKKAAIDKRKQEWKRIQELISSYKDLPSWWLKDKTDALYEKVLEKQQAL